MRKLLFILALTFSLTGHSQQYFMMLKENTAGNGYARSITVDKAKVQNTDQTNFPVLVTGTLTYLKTEANGGKVHNASGYDIFFSTTSGGSNDLNFEMVTWDGSTGYFEAWVKIPTLTTASNYVFYLKYGKTSISTYQGNNSGTWSNGYAGVYHFGDGTTLSLTDPSNSITGTNHSATATTGQVGGAINLNGSNQYVDFANNFGITGDVTIELWSNATNVVSILAKVSTGTGNAEPIKLGYYGGTNKMGLYLGNGSSQTISSSSTLQSASTWTMLGVSMSSSTYQFYFNGNTDGSGTNSATRTNNAGVNMTMGTNSGVGTEWYAGKIDELRISTVARSADWMKTTYNNTSSPSTFYTIGSETAL